MSPTQIRPPTVRAESAIPHLNARLESIFHSFDLDHSGGLKLHELQGCLEWMSISLPRTRVAEAFASAEHGTGEVNFAAFLALVDEADGGAADKIIHKVNDDLDVREMMRERCRPIETRSGTLAEQYGNLHDEHEWLRGLHMSTLAGQLHAHAKGYHGDASLLPPGAGTKKASSAPTPGVPSLTLPTLVTSQPPTRTR